MDNRVTCFTFNNRVICFTFNIGDRVKIIIPEQSSNTIFYGIVTKLQFSVEGESYYIKYYRDGDIYRDWFLPSELEPVKPSDVSDELIDKNTSSKESNDHLRNGNNETE